MPRNSRKSEPSMARFLAAFATVVIAFALFRAGVFTAAGKFLVETIKSQMLGDRGAQADAQSPAG